MDLGNSQVLSVDSAPLPSLPILDVLGDFKGSFGDFDDFGLLGFDGGRPFGGPPTLETFAAELGLSNDNNNHHHSSGIGHSLHDSSFGLGNNHDANVNGAASLLLNGAGIPGKINNDLSSSSTSSRTSDGYLNGILRPDKQQSEINGNNDCSGVSSKATKSVHDVLISAVPQDDMEEERELRTEWKRLNSCGSSVPTGSPTDASNGGDDLDDDFDDIDDRYSSGSLDFLDDDSLDEKLGTTAATKNGMQMVVNGNGPYDGPVSATTAVADPKTINSSPTILITPTGQFHIKSTINGSPALNGGTSIHGSINGISMANSKLVKIENGVSNNANGHQVSSINAINVTNSKLVKIENGIHNNANGHQIKAVSTIPSTYVTANSLPKKKAGFKRSISDSATMGLTRKSPGKKKSLDITNNSINDGAPKRPKKKTMSSASISNGTVGASISTGTKRTESSGFNGTNSPGKLLLGERQAKCRRMFGQQRRDLWCAQCKWKKACSRVKQLQNDGGANNGNASNSPGAFLYSSSNHQSDST